MDKELEAYLENIKGIPALSDGEEKDLARKISEENDEEAKRALARANLQLVVKIAQNYDESIVGVPLMKVIQFGNLGLYKAVDKYDYKKNFKFSTYATWWIRQAIVSNLKLEEK